jgi:catechol 2,3-dioxygenase
MTQTSLPPTLAPYTIDSKTTVGAVTLAVADLDKMTFFYQHTIGLTVLDQTARTTDLGLDSSPLVSLLERPDGTQFPRATGLYHLAIRLPSQADLGGWLQHLIESQYPLDGAGDHLVSEALYLTDPEGNGIEVYRDRPRESWQRDGQGIKMDTLPVNFDELLAVAPPTDFTGMPSGTRMGHVHLRVDDVPQSMRFYCDLLGFDRMAELPGAGFVSAGGYHHHIGMNTWASRGASPPPAGSLGLVEYVIQLPNTETRAALLERLQAAGYPYQPTAEAIRLHDPAGNGIVLR